MVRRVLEAGARGYVLKSDLAKHLVKAVKGVTQGKLFLTPRVSEVVLQGFLRARSESEWISSSQAKPTSREIQIIKLLAKGKANKEIASLLGITVRTAETHRAKIMHKLCLHSLVELVHYALSHGIVTAQSPPPES
jgi:DNA-binding NarL/FixJ family response regulator